MMIDLGEAEVFETQAAELTRRFVDRAGAGTHGVENLANTIWMHELSLV